MTREEAINLLQNTTSASEDFEQDEFWDAVDIAIKALENENALIDRVLEVIYEMERDTSYMLAVVDGKANGVLCNSRDVRDRILKLKGGDEE